MADFEGVKGLRAVSNVDEKGIATPDDTDNDSNRLQWTEEEEAKIMRKLDLVVMPLLMLGFFALQLDRGNIANALTDFFFRDVGITQNQFNIGQQLLSLGIVLLEIPSNYILYRVGPTKWISFQIFAWGLVSTFQAFQKGFGAFLATRLLLGMCESGFIPAGLYTMTRWYKRDETSKRYAWYFTGSGLASAITGLLAYGILHMRGVAGLGGWQWLFILEGIFTLLVGTAFVLFFPKSPSNPVNLFGYRYFSERETQILVERVLRDDPSKAQTHTKVTNEELRSTFTNWRLIPHIIVIICGLAPAVTVGAYSPTLVRGYGYGRLQSNAMVSIGAWISLVTTLIWGYTADKLGRRGPVVFVGYFLYWVFLCDRLLIRNPSRGARFAALTLTIGFNTMWHPVHSSWIAMNTRSAGERSITLAIVIMSANTSGIIGSQLFQSQDGPLYPIGWSVVVAFLSLGLVCLSVANAQYWLLNRRLRRGGAVKQYAH
ncbi:alternative sulfate transporter [Corynespora cassiicola Philippines]|uniref:Alternative sulfate transporter n=1 Tax=Corynespora cassiicola Philippines TaxID=1448308 RepID=A0A2T2NVU6_CORCC|nr:alternative sulfate transporter [Corynespora cassiicola Philippines]